MGYPAVKMASSYVHYIDTILGCHGHTDRTAVAKIALSIAACYSQHYKNQFSLKYFNIHI